MLFYWIQKRTVREGGGGKEEQEEEEGKCAPGGTYWGWTIYLSFRGKRFKLQQKRFYLIMEKWSAESKGPLMMIIISSSPGLLKRRAESSRFWMFQTFVYPKIAGEWRKCILSIFNKHVWSAYHGSRAVPSAKIQRQISHCPQSQNISVKINQSIDQSMLYIGDKCKVIWGTEGQFYLYLRMKAGKSSAKTEKKWDYLG